MRTRRGERAGNEESIGLQVVRANAERPRGPGLATGVALGLERLEFLKSSSDMFCCLLVVCGKGCRGVKGKEVEQRAVIQESEVG